MIDDDDVRSQQLAALKVARAAIDNALALLGRSDLATMSAVDRPKARWLRLKEAADECGWHPETMAAKARMHGLGRRDGRVWMIDMVRVAAWQDGKPYERLTSEVSASSGKNSDEPDDSSAAS